jgi:small subunit ribosomal protein S19e
MTTVYDIPARDLIEKTAEDLKENLKLERPEWSLHVKTGVYKERRPDDVDWWWTRAASVLRKIYIEGPIGVQRLCMIYGGKKNRGRRPEEFRRASGKVIRTMLKELDRLGLTENVKGGRRITTRGQSYLDGISTKIMQDKNVGAG